jgi:FAD:protein FMN transferase
MSATAIDNNLGFDFTAMACPCEIRIAGMSEADSEAAAQAAISEVRRIEHKYSRYRDDSILSRINAGAGLGVPVEVDEETEQLIKFAMTLYEQSGGLFDITSGVLRKVWDFKSQRVPQQSEIDHILPLVNMSLCSINMRKAYLTVKSMQIDFGGFGKEYAADRAALVLQQHGATSGFVNLGGDVHVFGPMPDGAPWTIGIAHPREENALITDVKLSQGAVATSGDAERYFELDGKRYCHVLCPKTGWPVSSWQSISVIGSNAIMAGALTTIAMLKQEQALPFLDSYQLPYFAVRADGEQFSYSSAVDKSRTTDQQQSLTVATPASPMGRFYPTR